MVTVEFVGRMGNCMFISAAAVGYALKHGQLYILPEWKGSEHFVGPFPRVPIPILPKYREPHFSYAEIPNEEDICLFGYYQSDKYWKHCEEQIRKMFSLNDPIKDAAWVFLREHMGGRTPVSLHVRRSDYLTIQETHPVLPLSYYKDALLQFDDGHHIFIYSDDIRWCENNMKDLHPNISFCGLSGIMDFAVASQCTHHIIANSSFSWWAAYLGGYVDGKVIAPKNWFGPKGPQDTQDLYCKNWIKI